eukprot:gb/GEZN01002333.1/.p1 GENE.gb/GEZN01002333.1/~~gb/GEZN01002333.1/.p1  ORF type:complete len:735 (-),score=104.82 gb/GEZN01002333.1/:322-2337(-)
MISSALLACLWSQTAQWRSMMSGYLAASLLFFLLQVIRLPSTLLSFPSKLVVYLLAYFLACLLVLRQNTLMLTSTKKGVNQPYKSRIIQKNQKASPPPVAHQAAPVESKRSSSNCPPSFPVVVVTPSVSESDRSQSPGTVGPNGSPGMVAWLRSELRAMRRQYHRLLREHHTSLGRQSKELSQMAHLLINRPSTPPLVSPLPTSSSDLSIDIACDAGRSTGQEDCKESDAQAKVAVLLTLLQRSASQLERLRRKILGSELHAASEDTDGEDTSEPALQSDRTILQPVYTIACLSPSSDEESGCVNLRQSSVTIENKLKHFGSHEDDSKDNEQEEQEDEWQCVKDDGQAVFELATGPTNALQIQALQSLLAVRDQELSRLQRVLHQKEQQLEEQRGVEAEVEEQLALVETHLQIQRTKVALMEKQLSSSQPLAGAVSPATSNDSFGRRMDESWESVRFQGLDRPSRAAAGDLNTKCIVVPSHEEEGDYSQEEKNQPKEVGRDTPQNFKVHLEDGVVGVIEKGNSSGIGFLSTKTSAEFGNTIEQNKLSEEIGSDRLSIIALQSAEELSVADVKNLSTYAQSRSSETELPKNWCFYIRGKSDSSSQGSLESLVRGQKTEEESEQEQHQEEENHQYQGEREEQELFEQVEVVPQDDEEEEQGKGNDDDQDYIAT